ncbi:NAD(P)-dependent oxidoreductase [Arenivirga flava]|uniref:NADPH nitroreductase n=1 Tax=Arenivirga flava TaxID=1930060 RepID=A0AA37XBC8_9MICO|nr:NAD(P)-dependent oxidoreductase [Arenivirga flava]GMA28275.1 NADPH nitroreductase [Arenivirga flava]
MRATLAGDRGRSAPVALLGLGAMGAPMARNLHAAGADLVVWNRTPARAEPFRAVGVPVAASLAEAARPVVITVLTDLDDVLGLLDGLRDGWAAACIAHPLLVLMGTHSPAATAELAAELAPVRIVDAPVSGGVTGAEAATLSVMVGGADADVAEASPFLRAVGSVVEHLGPLGAGQLAKACNQSIVAGTIAVISEAFLLAGRSGLDLAALRRLLEGGLAGSELLRQKGGNWVADEHVAGGVAVNQVKDLRFALAAAQRVGVAMPATATSLELFEALVAHGDGGLDHTGLIREIERRSHQV